jgi:endonuclease YncB( thermonuclease family)
VILIMQNNYAFVLMLFILVILLGMSTSVFLSAASVSSRNDLSNMETWFQSNNVLIELSYPSQVSNLLFKDTKGSYTNVVDATSPTIVKCQGVALCLKGEVVKVVNGKTFYVSINNRIYKIDLALIALPVTNQQDMIAATTFTRNNCLGGTVLIDQDDRQIGDSIIGTVYCSPTRSLNSLLLETGYVQLDKAQCLTSEFSKLDWARSHGC